MKFPLRSAKVRAKIKRTGQRKKEKKKEKKTREIKIWTSVEPKKRFPLLLSN